ncbi:ISAzo13 family transposase, partial [Patescibacteria group bacterium]|nr:ISAzo13 family transposase [Patescibacteria group bacterium]
HKLFCFISKNWRGKPLLDRMTVVNLIGSVKTKTGLVVRAGLDENHYDKLYT